jgi:hypothetical protein
MRNKERITASLLFIIAALLPGIYDSFFNDNITDIILRIFTSGIIILLSALFTSLFFKGIGLATIIKKISLISLIILVISIIIYHLMPHDMNPSMILYQAMKACILIVISIPLVYYFFKDMKISWIKSVLIALLISLTATIIELINFSLNYYLSK